jgi:membrane protein DedA with SNARE-associated domain
MFTLAHAHGTALALVNIVAGLTARHFSKYDLRPGVSFCLIWAGILFPVGFFLGGIVTYGGDPGLGIWLVPVGAILLFYAVLRIAMDVTKLVKR